MSPKKETLFGTIEFTSYDDEQFADVGLYANNGNRYYIGGDSVLIDPYEWVDCYVKAVGEVHKKNGVSYVRLMEVTELWDITQSRYVEEEPLPYTRTIDVPSRRVR